MFSTSAVCPHAHLNKVKAFGLTTVPGGLDISVECQVFVLSDRHHGEPESRSYAVSKQHRLRGCMVSRENSRAG